MIAWHFLKDVDGKPTTRTGRVMTVGDVETVDGAIKPCFCGLHGSIVAIDALCYAPGPWVQKAKYAGTVVHEAGKLAASKRRCLALANSKLVLHQFACWCAERALSSERAACREPDKRSFEAVEVKRAWLAGKATDEELSAASAAADAATKTAVMAAAGYAAWAACWFYSCDAAVCAAWYAAKTYAMDAAKDAERAAQNKKLEEILNQLLAEGKP